MVTTCIGFALLLSLVVGGSYLYCRVEELDRLIVSQRRGSAPRAEDDD